MQNQFTAQRLRSLSSSFLLVLLCKQGLLLKCFRLQSPIFLQKAKKLRAAVNSQHHLYMHHCRWHANKAKHCAVS
eukprot:scaffold607899_cov37-Prasinocladus_malaysianus.AAC.1